MLARPSAIKMIRPSLAGGPGTASDEAREMFEREAKAIATLRSPHTVHLFDYGVSDFGAFYYAMELLEGHDADWIVKRYGPLPHERAIHVLRQLCHSLSEAQSAGLVHRDIKPANVFLCLYGEEFDFVKVLDFGVVHAIRGVADTGLLEVDGGHIRGTPAVMSPEQARGSDVDGRADIYSTGCLAYFLLTGQHVFSGDDTISILVQHATATPVRPSERSPHPIPAELDDLIMACLAKEPADRPQTARELARRLAAIPGASDWTQERAAMWWRSQ
ncbi:MAG TPA: serine/threonine-protein kinase, partial [Vicinamibacterales bacterium]|nr:serine/threonine-protein kinase [Vicinamibacterales bacterium]